MAATYDGSIRINTKIDSAGAKVELASLTRSLKNFALTVGVAFGVGAVVNFTKECINLASDLAEVQNVIDTTFGSSVGLIEEFADTAAVSFGLSELAAKQYTGTMGAMLKSMGFTQQAAADMSMELAGLSGDLASFYNLNTDDAFEKIRSGISGETEPLKQLGVNLSEANLSAYAMAQGMTAAYGSLSEQNKALLRYNYLLDVTKDAQGDFAKTSSSWANQVRILQMQWDGLKGTLGGAFINVLTPILQMLNVLIGRLNAAATAFAAFIAAITGNSQKVTTASAEATDAVDGLTDSTTAAGAAAKKAGGNLAAFDELNTLADGSGSGSGTGSGVSTTVSETEATTNAVDDTTAALEGFKSAFDFTNLRESLETLKESFSGFKESIGSGLKWIYDNILVPLAAWTIEDALPVFLGVLAGAMNLLTAVIEALKPMAIWLWDNFLEPIAEWTGGIIVSVLRGIASALNGISDWIKNNQALVQGMAVTIGLFFGAWQIAGVLAFLQMAGGVTGATSAMVMWIQACTAGLLANKVATIALAGAYLKNLAAAIASTVSGLVTSTAAWVTSTAAKVADTIATTTATAATTAFSVALAFLAANPIVLVIAAIVALVAAIVLLATHWDTVKAKAAEVWSSITEVWAKASGWFSENVLTPIESGFKGAINNLISLAEGFINGFLGGINAIIKALNTIGIDVPEGVPFIGGTKFGVHIPTVSSVKLPRLARGAVIPPNREFMAVLGDQKRGTNLEAPESLIRQILQEELANIPNPNVTVVARGNAAGLIRYLKFEIEQVDRQMGKNLVEGLE